MKLFEIDPAIRLSAVPVFKLVAIGLPIIAIILSIIIYINSDLKLDLSFAGFNSALFTVYRVPLAILTACLAILGVISAIHRSAQATLQISKTTEQNIFSNFYKHRQEYIDHLKELRPEMPSYISDEMSEKVIRGFYNETYPLNNASNFTTKPELLWLTYFDKSLVELCYLLSTMRGNNNHNSTLLLYKEFIRQETSIRQDYFEIKIPENAQVPLLSEKTINVTYWDNSKGKLLIPKRVISSLFDRLCNYADLLTKLKYLADEFEGTILYGTSAYSGLSLMKNNNTLDSENDFFEQLHKSFDDRVLLSKDDSEEFSKLLNQIRESYDRKMSEIDAKK